MQLRDALESLGAEQAAELAFGWAQRAARVHGAGVALHRAGAALAGGGDDLHQLRMQLQYMALCEEGAELPGEAWWHASCWVVDYLDSRESGTHTSFMSLVLCGRLAGMDDNDMWAAVLAHHTGVAVSATVVECAAGIADGWEGDLTGLHAAAVALDAARLPVSPR